MARTGVRCAVACVPPALVALAAGRLVTRLLGTGPAAALVTLLVEGALLLLGYLLLVRWMRVPEVDQITGPVLARLGLGVLRPVARR